ncbi:MAG: glycosyltransferase family 4 protein [Rhodothermaceae bacterium]|nr:glycosyltransferase family 4 protein [Rhodothermaceae bacterium]
MKQVVLVTNIPTPYRIPLFNELDRQLREVGVKLIVIFGSNTYTRRKWVVDLSCCTFDYYVLKSKVLESRGNKEHTTFTFSGLARMLKRMNPDLVIAPGFSVATMKIWMLSFTQRFKFIIWTGSVERSGSYGSLLRVVQRRLLAAGASAFIVYGSAAKSYVESLGVPSKKISIGINTVDTSFFAEQTQLLRERLQPAKTKYLTFIGYLSRRKNVSDLVKTLIHLAQKRDDFVFEIIGDGDELPVLRNLVQVNQLGDRIVFHGYRQKEELPQYLARSNGFLFQTGFDIWGLVLNEAMAAGVPCIASKNACAVQDLLHENDAGFVVDFSNHERLLESIEWLLDNPKAGYEMGQLGKDYIANHASLSISASGFVKAIQKSMRVKKLQSALSYEL